MLCQACGGRINDRHYSKITDSAYHDRCVRCNVCDRLLSTTCFLKDGQVYCNEHFFRRYGPKCSGCVQELSPFEKVRRVHHHFYHVDCFLCSVCKKRLHTGEEFCVLEDSSLLCKKEIDPLDMRGHDGDVDNKRPRTAITATQLDALKKAYNKTSKPSRHVREKLSSETGLDMRVVQVWFQNRRAKEKRLKKDAGRQRSVWEHPVHGARREQLASGLKNKDQGIGDSQTSQFVQENAFGPGTCPPNVTVSLISRSAVDVTHVNSNVDFTPEFDGNVSWRKTFYSERI